MRLRQSTTATLLLGPFNKTSDAVTPCTSLAGTMSVYYSKNGGTFAATTGAISHSTVLDGWYKVPVTAANTNTCGRFQVVSQSATEYLAIWDNYEIESQEFYDMTQNDDFEEIWAKLVGKSYKSGNTYTFYNSTSGVSVTLTIASTARTRS